MTTTPKVTTRARWATAAFLVLVAVALLPSGAASAQGFEAIPAYRRRHRHRVQRRPPGHRGHRLRLRFRRPPRHLPQHPRPLPLRQPVRPHLPARRHLGRRARPARPTSTRRARPAATRSSRSATPTARSAGATATRSRYRVSGALNAFDEHDELYWNAIGDEWPVPDREGHGAGQRPGADQRRHLLRRPGRLEPAVRDGRQVGRRGHVHRRPRRLRRGRHRRRRVPEGPRGRADTGARRALDLQPGVRGHAGDGGAQRGDAGRRRRPGGRAAVEDGPGPPLLGFPRRCRLRQRIRHRADRADHGETHHARRVRAARQAAARGRSARSGTRWRTHSTSPPRSSTSPSGATCASTRSPSRAGSASPTGRWSSSRTAAS